jgi:hypothetical protein
MNEQIFNIVKITKLKHLFNALISPSHALKAFNYHYRRISEDAFISFFARQWDISKHEIDHVYRELHSHSSRWSQIKEQLSIYPAGYGLQMTAELSSLYLLIRLMKPDTVLETGVSSGASSAYILSALHDNDRGRLISIDLPPDNLPQGKASGWVVPPFLKERWSLHIGDSKNLLGPLLHEASQIDCFIHDSLHTYEHMMWEFRTAWPYLKQEGLFLSHDVGANNAFLDFMIEKGIPWSAYRVFHVLGGFKK